MGLLIKQGNKGILYWDEGTTGAELKTRKLHVIRYWDEEKSGDEYFKRGNYWVEFLSTRKLQGIGY